MSMIQLHTQDGQKFDAYFANAPRDDAPGLVLIQEIFWDQPSHAYGGAPLG